MALAGVALLDEALGEVEVDAAAGRG